VRLTSAEIERGLVLSERARDALKKYAANEPGWYISSAAAAPTLCQSIPSGYTSTNVWLPVSTESIALAAVKDRHEGSVHPAEWSATIDICSLPMFTPSGVSCGVRWMVGGSRSKVRVSGEGDTARMAALNFLAAYTGSAL
jgi:hypothetical protein